MQLPKDCFLLGGGIWIALSSARIILFQANQQMDALELAAEELRLAQLRLGEMTGEFTSDDLLGKSLPVFALESSIGEWYENFSQTGK